MTLQCEGSTNTVAEPSIVDSDDVENQQPLSLLALHDEEDLINLSSTPLRPTTNNNNNYSTNSKFEHIKKVCIQFKIMPFYFVLASHKDFIIDKSFNFTIKGALNGYNDPVSDVDECPKKLKSLGVIEPPPRKTVIRIDVDEDDELEDSDDTAIDAKVFAILECLIPYVSLNSFH